MNEKVLEVIREELEGKDILIIEVILFGSRARGDYNIDSDWDLLVVVNKELTFREKQEIVTYIYRRLAKMGIPENYEIILKSKESFDKMKEYVGNISYEADKEGLVLWKN
jgi:predicted nucleotidyltransferase